MGLRTRLRKLKQLEDEMFDTLTLPDGTSVRYRLGSHNEPGDMYKALLACIDRREHWLLPYLRQIDTTEGMPGLIRAIEGSRARDGD